MKIGKMPRNSWAPRFTSFRTQQPALRASFSSGEHTPALQRKEIQRPQRCYAIGSIVTAEWNDDDYIEVGTLGRAHGIKGEVIVGLSTSSPDERFGRPGKRYIQPPPVQGSFVTRPPEPPREVQLVGGRKHITKGNQVWLLRFDECPDRDTAETLRNYRVLIHKSEREALTDDDEFYSNDLVGLTVALAGDHPAVSATSACTDNDAAPAAAADGSAVDTAAGGSSCSDEEEWDEADDDDEEVVVALGEVVDVYDGTGTHGVLRIEFREGLQVMPDGQLEELSEDERSAAEASGQSTLTKANGLLPFARDIVPEVDLEDGLIVIDPPAGWLELYLTPKEKKKRKYRKRRSPKPLPVAIEA